MVLIFIQLTKLKSKYPSNELDDYIYGQGCLLTTRIQADGILFMR